MNKDIEKFLNGELTIFGTTENSGIETVAKLFNTKEEFYSYFSKNIESFYDIDDFNEINIYYSKTLKIDSPESEGICAYWEGSKEKNKPHDCEKICKTWGLEF